MIVEESIKVLEEIAEGFEKMSTEECARNDLRALWEGRAKGIRQAIALIKAHLRDQPNDPMTMKQLQEMDGDPVWVSTGRLSEWCIVHSCHSDDVIGGGVIMTRRTAEKRTYPYVDYGKTWLAYRRKPEEEII